MGFDLHPGPHPTQDLLGAYVDGSLRRRRARALEGHLGECSDCRQVAMAASRAWQAQETGRVAAMRTRPSWRRMTWEAPLGVAASLMLVAGLAVWTLQPAALPPVPAPRPQLGRMATQPSPAAPQAVREPPAPAQPPRVWATFSGAPPELPAITVPAAARLATTAPAPARAEMDFSTLRSGFQDQQASLSARGRLATWGGLIGAQPTLASASPILLPEPNPLELGGEGAVGPPELASGFQPAEATAPVPLAPIAASVGWAVSRSGELLRSVAAGIWKSVPLAPGVHVHVLYAAGNRVWAGGQADELFASSDHGAHWRRVMLPGARSKTELLHSILFAGPENGIITAANGQSWSTRDGGKTWVPR